MGDSQETSLHSLLTLALAYSDKVIVKNVVPSAKDLIESDELVAYLFEHCLITPLQTSATDSESVSSAVTQHFPKCKHHKTRKTAFELITALCRFNHSGFKTVLRLMEKFKVISFFLT